MGFFKELKERRLFQILATYAAAAWIALSVVDQLADRNIVPELVYQVALIWAMGGFFAALITGWYHGEKGAQEFSRSEVAMLALVGVAVLGISGFTVRDSVTASRVAEARSGIDEASLRRVAVLYFRDDSPAGDAAYLGDAFTEALIARLQTVPALTVVSRNGVLPFRSTDTPYDSIAGRLGVGTIVDGSVEQTGSRLRVNLRLIDGTTGVEISRAGFQRDPEDVLGAMGDLAAEAETMLRAGLSQEVELRETSAGTDVMAAWRVLQQGEQARKSAEAAMLAGQTDRWAAELDRADSLFADAAALDPAWPEPHLLRGQVELARAPRTRDLAERSAALDRGAEHADRALGLDAGSARALELRGSVAYLRYLSRLGRDAAEQAELLRSAREDLELATLRDPGLATAQSTLSHLYYQPGIGDVSAAALAARSAYEADAYLRNADAILERLFLTNLDMGQFRQASSWCDEGGRRFPADPRFSLCRLWIMTIPGANPRPDSAWAIYDRLLDRTPEARRDMESVRGEFLVAGALARAAMPDSARRVLERAHDRYVTANDPGSPLLGVEAFIWRLLDDDDRAIDLLKVFAATNHGFEGGGDLSWRWQGLREHPRFHEIVTRRTH